MSKITIGLDIGTTAIKAAAYQTNGTCLAIASRQNDVLRPAAGYAEQDMGQVWALVAECLFEISTLIDTKAVASIGLCAQGDGLWAIDENGAPIGHAILWNDTRASADLEQLTKKGATDPIGIGSGTSIWPGSSGMIWRWLKANRPEIAQKAHRVFTCVDWIGYKLTGQIGTDFANASIPFLDLEMRAYNRDQLEAIDCGELAQKLPAPVPAAAPLGPLCADAAAKTGLPEGLPISVGTLDLAATIVGMGLKNLGDTMMVMGTTAVVTILTQKTEKKPRPVGASALHPTNDAIIRILAPSTGASAFDWFTALHPLSLQGDTPFEIAQKLNEMVTKVPVGANGVTFMPYLNGERAPFVSPDIRANFHGLGGHTTTAELGRAVMEGTALSLRHCLEHQSGLPQRPVQLTGGGSQNAVWCQLIADVIGQDMIVSPLSAEAPWGAACIGAAAAGLGDPIALAQRDTEAKIYQTNPQNHQLYHAVYRRYEAISNAMQKLQIELNSQG